MGYFLFHHLVTLVLVAVAQFAKRLHLTVKKWCNMLHFGPWDGASVTVWPDWVIFCCLDDFLKPVATTFFSPNWPYYWAILKKCHFSSESIFWATFYRQWATFNSSLLVTLLGDDNCLPGPSSQPSICAFWMIHLIQYFYLFVLNLLWIVKTENWK